jgi:protoporphyrin/coproporphyrin ferrochelatase
MTNNTSGYGVLLVNMGGPNSTKEISSYLYRLFSDPYIIDLPTPIRLLVARLIAVFRRRTAASRYDLIGGKSPLSEETEKQARELSEQLQIPVTYAMRYTAPEVSSAMSALRAEGVTRLIVLPLYPQYCRSTSQTAIDHVHRCRLPELPYRIIEAHFSHPPYIDALVKGLRESLEKTVHNKKSVILFVAHSIPMKQVRSGDPYVRQVEETVAAVMKVGLFLFPHRLAFQSRIGPVKWQGPSLEEILEELVNDNVEQVVVMPVSFASENLETIFDLDMQFKEQCKKAGIEHYIRVPTPGVHPAYITAMSSLVKDEILRWDGLS